MGDEISRSGQSLISAFALALSVLGTGQGFAGPVELPVPAGLYGPESAQDRTKPLCDPSVDMIEISTKGITRAGKFCPWISITKLKPKPEDNAPADWEDFRAVTGCIYPSSPYDPRPNPPKERIVYVLSPRPGPPVHILLGEEESSEMFMVCQAKGR